MGKASRGTGKSSRSASEQDDSQRSHLEIGSSPGQWNRGAPTDFAITTVNVPDRLDAQEVWARADADAALPRVARFDRVDVRRWTWRLVGLAVVGLAIWGVVRVAEPVRAALSPAGIESQLRLALGVPVSVRATELKVTPSPRLVVRDITVQSGFQLPEVALHFNWRDAVHGLQSANWVLGEARVAPVKLQGAAAWALLESVRGASRLPSGVSTVRFESVEFPDLALLPGRYEAVLRRGLGQHEFATVSLKRLDGPGQVDLEIGAPAAAGGQAQFALFASNAAVPVGPAVIWNEATARGSFRRDELTVESYSVGSRFGTLNGAATIRRDGATWRLSGNLRGPGIAIDDLLRVASGAAETARPPFRGIARFDLAVSGAGATPEEAMRRATAGGKTIVESGVLEGVNLGLAATQGDLGPAGGSTRFTGFESNAVVGAGGVSLRGIAARAGGLSVSGSVSVDPKLNLSGVLRSEVASPRGAASAETRVGGTALAPTYRF